MPAFWVRPKRLPEGWVRSMSAVMGRLPWGPGAWVCAAAKRAGSVSRTCAVEMEGVVIVWGLLSQVWPAYGTNFNILLCALKSVL